MAVVDPSELKRVILEKYTRAKQAINLNEHFAKGGISDRIPGHKADQMKFGAYKKDEFVAMFADMRKSTDRALQIGAEKTFLTIHAVMTALIYVVEKYGGYIIDLPGDGIMALFKENRNGTSWGEEKVEYNSESLAVRSGIVLLESLSIVNEILGKDGIPAVVFGVGIDTGSVIVTKTGTDSTFDTKAIGNCVNQAAKKAHGENQIWISNQVYGKLADHVKKGFLKSTIEQSWYLKQM